MSTPEDQPTHNGLGRPPGTIGFGCPDRDNKILRLAARSPRSALAELTGAIMAPFAGNITVVFESPDQKIVPGDLDVIVLGADTFIQDLIFDIQAPNAFAGNVWKSMQDFFFNKTSGIRSTLHVTGRPKYAVADNPTPISSLMDFIPANWPEGWMLKKENSLHMDFSPGSPLPAGSQNGFFPYTVTATFRGWQYVCQDIDNLPMDKVLAALKENGYDVDYLAKFNYWR
jgi:hypothetical protein